MALKSYRGNCHCAAFVFEINLPEISKSGICNCSYCSKSGVVWAMTQDTNDFKMIKGDLETAKEYRFSTKSFGLKFCPTCGTTLLFSGTPPGGEKEIMGVNVRCFQHGLVPDIWKMEVDVIDGASRGTPYVQPKYNGPLPTKEVDSGKLYSGNCHCGSVTVCVKSKPLDSTYEDPVFQCNCSTCVRHGGVMIWPHKDQVVIQGQEYISTYSAGMLKAWEKVFCNNCGVFIVRRPLPVPDEVAAMLPAEARKWTVDAVDIRPINAKILNGVDISQLKITYLDGYDNVPPPYVNP